MQSSGEIEKLRSEIDELKEQLSKGTTDPADRTAMLMMLAAMRQELTEMRKKEVLLMQGEQA